MSAYGEQQRDVWGVVYNLTSKLVTKLPDNYRLFPAMIYTSHGSVMEQGLTYSLVKKN